MRTTKLALSLCLALCAAAAAQMQIPELLNYQGRLVDGTNLVNGSVGLVLMLLDSESGGTALYEDSNTVTVTDGLYSTFIGDGVVPGDLGTALENNSNIWIEATVNGVTLSPRERLVSAAYAFMAGSVPPGAIVSGMLAPQAVTGDKIADGTISNVDLAADAVTSDTIADGAVSAADVDTASFSTLFWRLDGNAGTTPGTHFLGTTDDQPLEFRVNSQRVFHVYYNTIYALPMPNIIGGCPANSIDTNSTSCTIGGGGNSLYPNTIEDSAGSVIAGGAGHRIYRNGGGTVGGGFQNAIFDNTSDAVIAGGTRNMVSSGGVQSVISGGASNIVGERAQTCVIGGGIGNWIGNEALVCTISGGWFNEISSNVSQSTIGGGGDNTIEVDAVNAVIGGGNENSIQREAGWTTLGGGFRNTIGQNADYSTIGGGYVNGIAVAAQYATVAGGAGNDIAGGGYYGAVGGGLENDIEYNAQVATIGGGSFNTIGTNAWYSVISGGETNLVLCTHGVVGGGQRNKAIDTTAIPFGGALVAGGIENTADGPCAVVGGGYQNWAIWSSATIAGGNNNRAGANYATVPGGHNNHALGAYSFAAGRRAKANHNGAFVWGDSTDADVTSTVNDQFLVRCNGGVMFTSAVEAVAWAPGSGAWTFTSDRDVKEGFEPVDSVAVLEKLAAMPMTEWNYKGHAEQRHIGPMAQDFHAAFPLNGSQTTLNSLDLDGVSLAAIQGLYRKLIEKDAQIAELQRQIDQLKGRME